MNKRYRVIDGSVSNHCCFEYTVVDSAVEMSDYNHYYLSKYGYIFEVLAECYTKEDAERVCDALNKADDIGCVPYG